MILTLCFIETSLVLLLDKSLPSQKSLVILNSLLSSQPLIRVSDQNNSFAKKPTSRQFPEATI